MSPAPPPPQPPPPLPTPLPYWTPSPWRRQGGQGRNDDITGKGLRTAVALSTASCLTRRRVWRRQTSRQALHAAFICDPWQCGMSHHRSNSWFPPRHWHLAWFWILCAGSDKPNQNLDDCCSPFEQFWTHTSFQSGLSLVDAGAAICRIPGSSTLLHCFFQIWHKSSLLAAHFLVLCASVQCSLCRQMWSSLAITCTHSQGTDSGAWFTLDASQGFLVNVPAGGTTRLIQIQKNGMAVYLWLWISEASSNTVWGCVFNPRKKYLAMSQETEITRVKNGRPGLLLCSRLGSHCTVAFRVEFQKSYSQDSGRILKSNWNCRLVTSQIASLALATGATSFLVYHTWCGKWHFQTNGYSFWVKRVTHSVQPNSQFLLIDTRHNPNGVTWVASLLNTEQEVSST